MPLKLDNLPRPEIVAEPEFQTIYDEMKATFLASLPDFADVEDTDPAFIVMQAWAYREMLLRQRQNDAARANFVNTARGDDLDNLAAFYSVERLTLIAADPDAIPPVEAVLETDVALRKRVVSRLEQCAPGSTAWFEGLALEAENPPRIKDVNAVSPSGGNVNVYLVIADHIPMTDHAAVVTTIDTYLSADAQKFIGVDPVVAEGTQVTTNFVAQVRMQTGYAFANSSTDIENAMRVFFDDAELIGRDLIIGEVYDALLSIEGVDTTVISLPTGNVAVTDSEYPAIVDITLTELT